MKCKNYNKSCEMAMICPCLLYNVQYKRNITEKEKQKEGKNYWNTKHIKQH